MSPSHPATSKRELLEHLWENFPFLVTFSFRACELKEKKLSKRQVNKQRECVFLQVVGDVVSLCADLVGNRERKKKSLRRESTLL